MRAEDCEVHTQSSQCHPTKLIEARIGAQVRVHHTMVRVQGATLLWGYRAPHYGEGTGHHTMVRVQGTTLWWGYRAPHYGEGCSEGRDSESREREGIYRSLIFCMLHMIWFDANFIWFDIWLYMIWCQL